MSCAPVGSFDPMQPLSRSLDGSESLCNEQEESRRITAVHRLDEYRTRLNAANGPDERHVIHEAIAGELAADHTSLAGCAAALLSTCLRPHENTHAWNILSAIRDSDGATKNGSDAAKCLRLCAQVAAHWGAAIVRRYAWASRARSFLERLWSVAQLHQDWTTAVRYLNAVLVLRHELVLLGRLSPSMRHWQTIGNEVGEGAHGPNYSPVTAADLKNVLDWEATSRLNLGGICLRSLDEAEKAVMHWTSATADSIRLADGSSLSSRPQSVWNRCMIAHDAEGLITREDTLERRPERGDVSPERATKRLRLDDSGISLDGDSIPSFASSTVSSPNNVHPHRLLQSARVRNGFQELVRSSVARTSASDELEEPNGSDAGLSELTDPDPHDSDGEEDGMEDAEPLESSNQSEDEDQSEGTVATEHSYEVDDAEDADSPPFFVGQDGSKPYEKLIHEDENDARSRSGSEDTFENLQDEHASSDRLSQSPLSDHVEDLAGGETPNSTASSMMATGERYHAQSSDCPFCDGLCAAGFVPKFTLNDSSLTDTMASTRRKGFEVIHSIKDLVSDRCKTDAKAHVLSSWTLPSHLASVFFDPDDDSLSSATREEAEVWCLSSDCLHRYLLAGIVLDRPVLIKNAVRDAGWLTWERCQAMLRSKLEGRVLQVRDPISHALLDMDGEEILENLSSPDAALNALDLPGLVRGDRPAFTLLPQYRLLEDLVYNEAWDEVSKQITTKELDILGCTRFNILGFRGAFSGAHMDTLNGTWVRSFCGRKAWMFVPPNKLDNDDLRRLAQSGDAYDPRGKGRIMIIEQDEVLLMPPGVNIAHAVLTLETSLMEGAMLWDESMVNDILKNIHWIAMHQQATNEPWPNQIQAVVSQLDRAVVHDTKRFIGKTGRLEDFMKLYEERSRAIHALLDT
ncbi:hypothetical protein LTR27_012096 [Elasticomyces elasticus]|nr:hypothetical protein LTR27_012096 [Elasticomyces elasticus]